MNIQQFMRQGDVGIIKVLAIPSEATLVPAEKNTIVLAYGEQTGHSHRIDTSDAVVREFTMTDAQGVVRRFLNVMSSAVVVHEEHAPIPLQEGTYEIIQQREYFPEAIRNVAD
jgi:hypothetical protein